MIGNKDDTEAGLVMGDQLLECCLKEFAWEAEEFPQYRRLGFSLHLEDGGWHIQERGVWIAHDEDGNEIVDQGKALVEMGIPRWDEEKYQADMAKAEKIPDEKKRKKAINQTRRYNNAKMTYTARCREHFQQICKEYGFEIITEPKEPGKAGLRQQRYINEQLKEENKQMKEENGQLKEENKQMKEENEQLKDECDRIREKIDSMAEELKTIREKAYKEGYQEGWKEGVANGANSPSREVVKHMEQRKQREITEEEKRRNARESGIGMGESPFKKRY